MIYITKNIKAELNRILVSVLLAVLLNLLGAESIYAAMSYLDNGVIRIGVDLNRGGTITELKRLPNGTDIINSFDLGRMSQQSYYSGPAPFGTPHPSYPNWGWNPVAAGDVYGHAATVLQQTNDGTTIYVKRIPKQWALNNVDSESFIEEWITLENNVVKVRCRLENFRSDTTFYGYSSQELPAIYTNPPYTKIFTYNGSSPFTNGALTEIIKAGPPWTSFTATESWTALVDSTNQGVAKGIGLYNPGVHHTLGGTVGIGTSIDWSDTAYLSPILAEHIDHNIVYEYEYYLIVGSLTEIRNYTYAHKPTTIPHWHFQKDRQHWYYTYATDSGFPIDGKLHVNLDSSTPQMVTNLTMWQAEDVPKLYIRAKFSCANTAAQLYWQSLDGGDSWDLNKAVWFDIIPDGQYHTYVVDMSVFPTYSGIIKRLWFNLIKTGAAGNYVDIEYISAYPLPGDFNRDRTIDLRDLAEFSFNWGNDRAAGFVGDLDGDRKVNTADLNIMTEYWLTSTHFYNKEDANIPSTISGLVLWLDANDTSTITLNGGKVSNWNDKSGFSNNAIQLTAGQQPAYVSNYVNGKAAIIFDGSDDCLNISDNSSLDVSNITVFVVLRNTNPDNVTYPTIFNKLPMNQAYLFQIDADNQPFFRINGGGTLYYAKSANGNRVVDSFSDWMGWYDGKVLKFFINGWQAASTTVSPTGVPIQSTAGELTIGSGTSYGLNGSIAEIIMYNKAIDENDRLKLRRYLAAKYDLSE